MTPLHACNPVNVKKRQGAISSLFAHLDRADHPGASVAVISGGRLEYSRCFGVADLERPAAITPDTVFRLGSTSKHLCATALLLIRKRGLLDLDDPVCRHIPELPACCEGLTIRHLLTMRSGLHDGVELTLFGANAHLALTRAQHLRIVSRYQELMFAPGERMLYSNTNYALVSLIIERMTRLPLAQFLREEIFAPLGMTHSRLIGSALEPVANRARGYMPAPQGAGLQAGLMLYETSGDGGIDLSMRDFIRWAQNYRADRLIGPGYRELMEATTPFPDGMPGTYGLGLYVTRHRAFRKISHAGGMPGYLADFSYPELDLAVLLLSNWMEPELLETADRIVDLLADLEPAPPGDEPTPGLYICPSRGLALDMVSSPQGACCHLLGERSLLQGSRVGGYRPLKRSASYRILGGVLADAMTLSFGSGSPAVFQRCSAAAAPSQTLEEFCGEYRSALLGEAHRVYLEPGGVLEIRLESAMRDLAWRELVWRSDDFFLARIPGNPCESTVAIRFERDRAGRIRGLRYSTQRCRDLLFARREDSHAAL